MFAVFDLHTRPQSLLPPKMALVEFASTLPTDMRDSVPIIATVSILYLSWRIWRFSISPALSPSRPKPLPNLVPCKQRPMAAVGGFILINKGCTSLWPCHVDGHKCRRNIHSRQVRSSLYFALSLALICTLLQFLIFTHELSDSGNTETLERSSPSQSWAKTCTSPPHPVM